MYMYRVVQKLGSAKTSILPIPPSAWFCLSTVVENIGGTGHKYEVHRPRKRNAHLAKRRPSQDQCYDQHRENGSFIAPGNLDHPHMSLACVDGQVAERN